MEMGPNVLTSTFSRLKYAARKAGIAQLVEHNLAKVGVASSNLVSRSKISERWSLMAGWQSGYAAACKAVYVGSIPALASNKVDPKFCFESTQSS
jgi:hypothetical protein